MKSIASIILLSLLSLSFCWGQKDYSIGSFSSIKALGGVRVELRKAYNPSLEISQDYPVEVYTEDNKLVIRMKPGSYKFKEKKTVVVNYTRLKGIEAKGGANVYANEAIRQSVLALYADGGANIHCQLDVEEAALEAVGGGNIHVEGRVSELLLRANGGGNIDARQLDAQNVTAHADGGGNIVLSATNSLTARSKAGGNIVYHGNPSSKSVNKDGGGRVANATGKAAAPKPSKKQAY